MPENLLAQVREFNTSCGTQEHMRAQAFLKIVDFPADCRWRLAEACGCRAHARQLGNHAKNAQGIPIQAIN
jgi:hypothetical protein